MPRYLLVPGDPSSMPAAIERARALADATRGAGASFVLLTPRARGVRNRPAAEHIAGASAIVAAARLRQAGLRLERSEVGDASPVLAIEDALRAAPHAYDAVIFAARVSPVARAFGLDDHARAEALPLLVLHVYIGSAGARRAGAGLEGGVPDPLLWRLRRALARAAAPLRAVGRAVEDRRFGAMLIMAPMVCYLAIGLGLALFVNRAFLLMDAVAFSLDAALLVGLLASERAERRRLRRRLLIEEATDTHRERSARTR